MPVRRSSLAVVAASDSRVTQFSLPRATHAARVTLAPAQPRYAGTAIPTADGACVTFGGNRGGSSASR